MLKKRLIAYFYSGWAFFVPYLAAYLLYAWLNWPVNPSANVGVVTGGGSASAAPSLLHVYWSMHAIHLVLGIHAFHSWWAGRGREAWRPKAGAAALPGTVQDHLWPVLPWICLAVAFWIPGVYLEWPSDPWEHLRRINEWHAHETVAAHSEWKKSSYFFPYSLTGLTIGSTQLQWINYYYTAICLLLCWQYYRLARAIGLGSRVSFVFVLLNAFTFGNNIFSFYRYYGLSSSIYAQLGAVALTRIVLEWRGSMRNKSELVVSLGSQPGGSPTVEQQGTPHPTHRTATADAAQSLASCCLLVLFVFFNHIQGVGIAGMGITAVVIWRLIEWKRAMIFWLIGATLVLSIIVVSTFPRHDALDQIYRPSGWLTSWYGFNLFDMQSSSSERTADILGVLGVLNIAAGLFLITRNHLVGWLTVIPPLLLSLPVVAIPFANALLISDTILTFHRMLFAIPGSMAITCVAWHWRRQLKRGFIVALPVALLGAVALPTRYPAYNRYWNSTSHTPADLDYTQFIQAFELNHARPEDRRLFSTESIGSVLQAVNLAVSDNAYRENGLTPIRSPLQLLGLPAAANPAQHPASPALNVDPMTRDPNAWRTHSGSSPTFVDHVTDLPGSSTAMQNPPGSTTETFTAELIALDPLKSYQLEFSVKLSGDDEGTASLAIAWYDREERFLDASAPPPRGAGYPTGWQSGTYSYFGLISAPPPRRWRTYRVSFGRGEIRRIPPYVAFARIGALLNDNQSKRATIQISNVRITEKNDSIPISDGTFGAGEKFRIIVNAGTQAFTPASHAGFLSNHWLSQQSAAENTGAREIDAIFGQLDGMQAVADPVRDYRYDAVPTPYGPKHAGPAQ